MSDIKVLLSCDNSHFQEVLKEFSIKVAKISIEMQEEIDTKFIKQFRAEQEEIRRQMDEFEESMRKIANLVAITPPSMKDLIDELKKIYECETPHMKEPLPRPHKIISIPVIKINKKREHIYYHCRDNC